MQYLFAVHTDNDILTVLQADRIHAGNTKMCKTPSNMPAKVSSKTEKL